MDHKPVMPGRLYDQDPALGEALTALFNDHDATKFLDWKAARIKRTPHACSCHLCQPKPKEFATPFIILGFCLLWHFYGLGAAFLGLVCAVRLTIRAKFPTKAMPYQL